MSGEADAGFSLADEYYAEVKSFLCGPGSMAMEHGELEEVMQDHARELFRRLAQNHADLRAAQEQRLPDVADAKDIARPSIEANHVRSLSLVFGEISGPHWTQYEPRRRRCRPDSEPWDRP